MVVCILNRCHPHPGTLGREYAAAAAAFLSRRHLPRGIGCYTVAQTQNWTRPKNTKNWTQAAGKKTPSSKRRLGSGFVEALLISCHMVQLSDHQHDLNVCQQWNFHRIVVPGRSEPGTHPAPMYPVSHPLPKFLSLATILFCHNKTGQIKFSESGVILSIVGGKVCVRYGVSLWIGACGCRDTA